MRSDGISICTSNLEGYNLYLSHAWFLVLVSEWLKKMNWWWHSWQDLMDAGSWPGSPHTWGSRLILCYVVIRHPGIKHGAVLAPLLIMTVSVRASLKLSNRPRATHLINWPPPTLDLSRLYWLQHTLERPGLTCLMSWTELQRSHQREDVDGIAIVAQ